MKNIMDDIDEKGRFAEQIRDLTRELRKSYYQFSTTQNHIDTIPFGGSIRESIGPFPEFILKGRFCKRSLLGLCTPCFYSRLPERLLSDESFDLGYLSQVDYIINNFDEIVLKKQIGQVAFGGDRINPIYGLVCTPTGSYFDNSEYPVEIRKENLKKFLNIASDRECEIALHIESHVEDIIEYFKKPDMEEIELLLKLNTRIILGFESYNDFSRNVIYGKKIEIQDFEKAVSIIRGYGLPVGAFVFAGLFAYNDYETINDVIETLTYLKKHNISPVIMFANTQRYTIPDVLANGQKFKLLDAHTVLEITKCVVDMFGCNMTANIDPWFIADPKGGPPEPDMHIFNSRNNTACNICSQMIYDAIEELRITKNADVFVEKYHVLKKCTCYDKYNELISANCEMVRKTSLAKRLSSYIEYVDMHKEYYYLKQNPWLVKAELLCYGLCLSQKQKDIVKKNNTYAEEKGLIHAIHIKYENIFINVCIAERFCERSPYTAEYNDEKKNWRLKKAGIYLGEFVFLTLPDWTREVVDGEEIGKIIRPHSDKCLSLWPSTECVYVQQKKGCKFCGLNSESESYSKVLGVKTVSDAIKYAFFHNRNYEINLSGGTCGSPEKAIYYFIELCRNIKKINCNAIISVECAPPQNNELILELYKSGATALIMNIEIYNEKLRSQICPGKAEISVNRYMEALRYAVSLFGKGNVSTVLIMGLQPVRDIKVACEELVKEGIVPTIMPFKPLDGTILENYDIPNPDEYVLISQYVARLMEKNGLTINADTGCAACGACSLETNLIRRK